jgi:hypothetical protein
MQGDNERGPDTTSDGKENMILRGKEARRQGGHHQFATDDLKKQQNTLYTPKV